LFFHYHCEEQEGQFEEAAQAVATLLLLTIQANRSDAHAKLVSNFAN